MRSAVKSQQRMVKLLDDLHAPEGAQPSSVPGVTLLRTTRYAPPVPVLYEPCIAIVAQGSKRFHLPDRVVTYDARRYLVLTVPVPAECETEAAEDGPFLGIAVRIELDVLSELLMRMGPQAFPSRQVRGEEWLTTPAMTPDVADVTIRLLQCLYAKADADVLGPQLVRELTYRVLRGSEGGALQDLLQMQGAKAQIHRVLHRMHTHFAEPLQIASLAHEAGMSISALHEHFKAVTQTSPLQYVKMIRLHKARMLMVQDDLGAAGAAERVGYESASQFSREFKRFFGVPPAFEAQRVRVALGVSSGVRCARSV